MVTIHAACRWLRGVLNPSLPTPKFFSIGWSGPRKGTEARGSHAASDGQACSWQVGVGE